MNKDNSSGVPSDSVSGVGQTASMGKSTSVSSGAAKVFREFKWGLLTLFLLMVVVVGLVYDGGTRKKTALAPKPSESAMDINLDSPAAPPAVPGASDPLLGPVTGNDPLLNGAPSGPITDVGVPPVIPTAPTNPGYTLPTAPGNHITPPTQYNDRHTGVVSAPPAPPVAPPVTPTTPVPPTTETAGKTYKVQSGDTLSSIAQSMKLGKGGIKALIAANKTTLPDPNRLKVGMTLNVPAPAAANPATAATPATPTGTKVAMTDTTPKLDVATPNTSGGDYTVQSGDTLERIARKVFSDGRRWQDIHNWNRDQLPDPARLRVGQVLKIKQNGKTSTNKPKVSEAEGLPNNEEKAAIVETPLLPIAEKENATPVKESKKKIAVSEKHDEPKVEIMSATSSAFAP